METLSIVRCSAPVFLCCLRAPASMSEQRKDKRNTSKELFLDSRGRESSSDVLCGCAVLAALENGFRPFQVEKFEQAL